MKIETKMTKAIFNTIKNGDGGHKLFTANPFDAIVMGARFREDLKDDSILANAFVGPSGGAVTDLEYAVYVPKIHLLCSMHELCQTCPFGVQIDEKTIMNLADYISEVHRLGSESEFKGVVEKFINNNQGVWIWLLTTYMRYIRSVFDDFPAVLVTPSLFMVGDAWEPPVDFGNSFKKVHKSRFFITSNGFAPVGQSRVGLWKNPDGQPATSMETQFVKTLLETYRSITCGDW